MPLAGIADIASMKVIAVCQRGTKRDFVDLYFILKDMPFRSVAENMVKRFGRERVSPMVAGKSLVYFADGESDPDVRYGGKLRPSWDLVKGFFKRNVHQMVRSSKRVSKFPRTGAAPGLDQYMTKKSCIVP